MNTFRINYLMERLHTKDLGSAQLDAQYKQDLMEVSAGSFG
jgi:hypothetical protein